jgi:hypothetical protein
MSVLSERLIQVLNDALGAEGWSDIRDQLPQHPKKRFGLRPMEGVDGIAVHQTAGSRSGTPAAAADFHVEHNDWPGIGYHFWVGDNGHAFYVGTIETSRAHVLEQNDHLIGIVLAGNFQGDVKPSDAALATTLRLVRAMEALLSRRLTVKGHCQWMADAGKSGYTECPGVNLIEHLPELSAGPATSPGRPEPAPVPTQALIDFGKDTRVLRLNRTAGIQRAILAAGFVMTGNEGHPNGAPSFVAQVAEHPRTTEVRVYWYDPATGRSGSLTIRPPSA